MSARRFRWRSVPDGGVSVFLSSGEQDGACGLRLQRGVERDQHEIINFNTANSGFGNPTPGHTDQRALRVKDEPDLGNFGDTVNLATKPCALASGGTGGGSPNEIHPHIRIFVQQHQQVGASQNPSNTKHRLTTRFDEPLHMRSGMESTSCTGTMSTHVTTTRPSAWGRASWTPIGTMVRLQPTRDLSSTTPIARRSGCTCGPERT
jgi:hypothetical protein